MRQTFSAGTSHSVFVSEDLCAFGCGNNATGALGFLDRHSVEPSPVTPFPMPLNICSVSAGNSFSLFLQPEGIVWTAGKSEYENFSFEWGTVNGAKKMENVPLIQQISASQSYHAIFLDIDGYAWGCGLNSFGGMGVGHRKNQTQPSKIQNLPKLSAISAGTYHTLFLSDSGEVWSCGDNSYGQLGVPTSFPALFPVKLEVPVPIVSISGGNFHSLFLDIDGNVWSCGMNTFGQLGCEVGTLTVSSPRKISGVPFVSEISAGQNCSLLLTRDGEVWASGDAKGLNINSPKPKKYSKLPCITTMSSSSHYLFLDCNSRIWVTGENCSGQLGTDFDKDYRKRVKLNKRIPPVSRDSQFTSTKSARTNQ